MSSLLFVLAVVDLAFGWAGRGGAAVTPFWLLPFQLLPFQLLLAMFYKFSHGPRKIFFDYHAHHDGNFAFPRHPSQRRDPDYTSDNTHLEAAASQKACHRSDPDPKQDHVTCTASRPCLPL
jgi:hypothetical protein